MTTIDPLGDKLLISVTVVDIAETARRFYGDKAAEIAGVTGQQMLEADYRFKANTPTGGEITFHRGASADHVAAYWEREGWLGTTPQPSPAVEITEQLTAAVITAAQRDGVVIADLSTARLIAAEVLRAAGIEVAVR